MRLLLWDYAKFRRAFSIRTAIPLPIGPIRSVGAQGWEHVPKMIVESEKQYWAIAASVPRNLAMASGVSAHGDGETKGDM
jgi:hypothetical protein